MPMTSDSAAATAGATAARPRPSRRRSYRTGMTAPAIVGAALELTRERGLDDWTMRDVADRLDTWPSVLYHHVGDRDALVWSVIDRLIQAIDTPDPDLEWQDWFRAFLGRWPQWLADYPGVAEFLVLHGPAVPGALAILDQGMTTLLRAGFGADAPVAYSMLLNTAAMQVAIVDRRRRQPVPVHTALGAAMDGLRDPGPGLRTMREFVRTFAEDPDRAAAARTAYFRTTIDVVIAGWEARLGHGPAGGD